MFPFLIKILLHKEELVVYLMQSLDLSLSYGRYGYEITFKYHLRIYFSLTIDFVKFLLNFGIF